MRNLLILSLIAPAAAIAAPTHEPVAVPAGKIVTAYRPVATNGTAKATAERGTVREPVWGPAGKMVTSFRVKKR